MLLTYPYHPAPWDDISDARPLGRRSQGGCRHPDWRSPHVPGSPSHARDWRGSGSSRSRSCAEAYAASRSSGSPLRGPTGGRSPFPGSAKPLLERKRTPASSRRPKSEGRTWATYLATASEASFPRGTIRPFPPFPRRTRRRPPSGSTSESSRSAASCRRMPLEYRTSRTVRSRTWIGVSRGTALRRRRISAWESVSRGRRCGSLTYERDSRSSFGSSPLPAYLPGRTVKIQAAPARSRIMISSTLSSPICRECEGPMTLLGSWAGPVCIPPDGEVARREPITSRHFLCDACRIPLRVEYCPAHQKRLVVPPVFARG